MSDRYFKNHFLVAMPGLVDPAFHQTVTYICEHHQGGAMGIIINQPLTLTIGKLFSQLDLEVESETLRNQPLNYGGPVQKERGFVLHNEGKTWESTLAITDEIAITGSPDIFTDMASGNGPSNALIALGYAGWDSGQLENEVAENSWLLVPADVDILFHTEYDQRWQASARKLGIDLNLMPQHSGHA